MGEISTAQPSTEVDRRQQEVDYYRRQLNEFAAENLRHTYTTSALVHELTIKRKVFSWLAEVSRSITFDTPLETLLDTVVRGSCKALEMERAVVLAYDPDTTDWLPLSWNGFTNPPPALRTIITVENTEHPLVINGDSASAPIVEAIRAAFALPFFLCVRVESEPVPHLLIAGRIVEQRPFSPALTQGDADALAAVAAVVEGHIRSRRVASMREELASREIDRREAEINRLRNVELAGALDDLKQAQSQLVQSEKMVSLGQLTAGVAHEINNPINFIRASTSPLRRDLNEINEIVGDAISREAADVQERIRLRMGELQIDDVLSEIDSLLNGIDDGASRTAMIVKGLRTFSRLDEGDLKLVDIHDGIDSALTLLGPRLGSINIVRDFGEMPPVECNPGQINQAIMNILNNAIDAMYGEGQISIRTRLNDDAVSIAIADSGRGIDEHDRARIFDPFFTTKDVGAGTGLGLSITYGIVEQHGGTIDVQSIKDIGSTFNINLPARRRP